MIFILLLLIGFVAGVALYVVSEENGWPLWVTLSLCFVVGFVLAVVL